jgi:hypothetical protein
LGTGPLYHFTENELHNQEKLKRIVPDAIRAFISANIPIIAPIYIKKKHQ